MFLRHLDHKATVQPVPFYEKKDEFPSKTFGKVKGTAKARIQPWQRASSSAATTSNGIQQAPESLRMMPPGLRKLGCRQRRVNTQRRLIPLMVPVKARKVDRKWVPLREPPSEKVVGGGGYEGGLFMSSHEHSCDASK